MPVDIVSINFLDADFNTISTGVDYLNGSIGDKLTAEITFDVHWETRVDFNGQITTTINDAIRRFDGGSYISDGFQVGDTILVSSPLNVMVAETIVSMTPNEIFLSGGLVTAEAGGTLMTVYGTTPVQNVDYLYGIIDNGSPNTTISLIDASIPKFKSGVVDHTVLVQSPLLPNTTINSWVYDLADQNSTIEGLGLIGINQQRFKIIHEFYIEPVFVAGDLNTGGGVSAPNYLANVNSLKYVPRIDCRYATNGTNVDKSTSNGNIDQFIKSGDVGYFDELGNAGTPDYTKDSIVYKKTLDSTIVGAVQPNAETDVTITLRSDAGAFSNTGTDFILQIYRTPTDTTIYEGTATDIKENFLVSRQSLLVSDVPTITGDGFIKAGATVTFVSANEVDVDFTFLPTFFTSQDQVLNNLQAFNQDPANVADGYLIFVTCQDKTITSKVDSDKVAVLCDVNKAEGIDPDDFYNTTGVCETVMLFNDHPTNDPLLAFTDYKGWLEDSVVTKTNIQVLKTNNDTAIDGNTIQNVWNLNNITFKIEAEHKTDATRFFTLEERTFVAGLDVTETRNFILPIGEPQNEIVWAEGVETGTHKQYDLQYPFKIKWEDWKVLLGADNDFPSATQDWVTYINADWAIKVNIYKEIDLAQDLGLQTCTFTFSVNNEDVEISLTTNTFTATWTDAIQGIVGTTNALTYTSALVTRDLEMGIEDCTDVTGITSYDSGIVGDLDLSVFTNLDSVNITQEPSLTSLVLPASGGSSIDVRACQIATADYTGFTGLTSIYTMSCPSLASILLPTLPSGSTLGFVNLNANGLTAIDLLPILPAMSNGAYIRLYNNKLTVAEVNQALIDIDATGYTGGVLQIHIQTPAAAPTGAGATAKANLISNGWNVITD